MRDWIEIQEKTSGSQNATGEKEWVWTLKIGVMARMDFRKRGSEELMMGLQQLPMTSVECSIYTIEDLTTQMRVVYKEQMYNIDSILEFEGGRFQMLELVQSQVDAR